MGLSCECEFDGEASLFYDAATDYTTLQTKQRKRCGGCKQLIEIGTTVVAFEITRAARNDIEERIYGDGYDAIRMASKYYCETCGDLYFSLVELGFCAPPDEDLREMALEYNAIYVQKKP